MAIGFCEMVDFDDIYTWLSSGITDGKDNPFLEIPGKKQGMSSFG
jgi:hypothetical protein